MTAKARMSIGACIVAVLAIGAAAGSAQATTYGFEAVSNNTAANVLIVEAQLTLTVTMPTAGEAAFKIDNAGSDPATVTNVYFDDIDSDFLLDSSSASLSSTGTVVFSAGGSPPTLASGEQAVPPFDDDFHFSADPPPSSKGIDPGESLTITFDLLGSHTFTEVIDALNSGNLRVGLLVISIGDNEDSESVVNVPEPASAALLGVGVAAVLGRRRR